MMLSTSFKWSASRAGPPELDAGVRLAPAILIHDLVQRAAADRTELAPRPANWDDRVGVNVRRQAERCLGFPLIEQMARRQRRAEAQGAGRQDQFCTAG
jgi:hypothetical protein